MKKCLFISLVVFMVVTMCYATDVSGKWAGTIGGLYDITVNMKEDNGKISCTASTEIGDIPLNGGTITGSDVVFKQFSYNGLAVSYVKAKIDGDKMNVSVGFQGQNFQGTLKRIKPPLNLPR